MPSPQHLPSFQPGAATHLACPAIVSCRCVLAVLVFLAAWLPNPMDTILAQRQAVRQEAARQAERVEQLRQQIEQAEELSLRSRLICSAGWPSWLKSCTPTAAILSRPSPIFQTWKSSLPTAWTRMLLPSKPIWKRLPPAWKP